MSEDRVEELEAQLSETMPLLENITSTREQLTAVLGKLKRAHAKNLFQRLLYTHRCSVLNQNLEKGQVLFNVFKQFSSWQCIDIILATRCRLDFV